MSFHEAEVTKSLYNMYRQPTEKQPERVARVIDSNEIIARKLQELQQEKQIVVGVPDGSLPEADGFTPGLFAQEVEVVPEVDYVAEAKEEAERILEEARAEADAVRQEARIQAENVKETARNEGYQKGYEESTARGEQELAIKLAELEEKKEELFQNYEAKLADMEPQLLDAIIQVVEKVFHIQFADKKEILLYLLSNTINGIEGCRHFQIRVGRNSYEYVNAHKAEIEARIGSDMTLDVIAGSAIAEDKCMIETDTGVFDCSLDVEFENLIKALRSLVA